MILKDIIEEINGLLDHNPNVATHENHLIRLVNRHYQEICSSSPWRFLQERATKQLYQDFSGSAGTTLTLTNNSKTVTAAAGTWLHSGMEGAVIEDTANSIEYRIDSVLNNTTAFLTEATGASAAVTGTTDFKVKWDKIKRLTLATVVLSMLTPALKRICCSTTQHLVTQSSSLMMTMTGPSTMISL